MHDSWIQQNNDATLYINNHHIHSHMSHQYNDRTYLNGFKKTQQQTTTVNHGNGNTFSNSSKHSNGNGNGVVILNNNELKPNGVIKEIILKQDKENEKEKPPPPQQQTLKEDNTHMTNNVGRELSEDDIKSHNSESSTEEEEEFNNSNEYDDDEVEEEDDGDIYQDEEEEEEEIDYLEDEEEEDEDYIEEDEEDDEEEEEEDEEDQEEEIKEINQLSIDNQIDEDSHLKVKSSELDNSKLGNEKDLLYLEYEWSFYYDQGVPKNTDDFSSHIENLGNFNTVQGFWNYWNNFKDLSSLPDGANLRLFKNGIKPVWEDKENENGGRWVYQTKGIPSKVILDVILHIIGEQLEYSIDICGFVYSVRPGNRQFVSIWNKSGSNQEIIDKTISQFSTKLNLSFNYTLHNKQPQILNSPPYNNNLSMSTPMTPTPYTGSGNSLNSSSSGFGFTPIHHSTSSTNISSLQNSSNEQNSPKSNYHHKKSQSTSSLPVNNYCTKQQPQQQQQVLNSPFSSYSNRNTKYSLVNSSNNINNGNELLPSVTKTTSQNGTNRKTIDKHISSPTLPIPFSIKKESNQQDDLLVDSCDHSKVEVNESQVNFSSLDTKPITTSVELIKPICNNSSNNIETLKQQDNLVEDVVQPSKQHKQPKHKQQYKQQPPQSPKLIKKVETEVDEPISSAYSSMVPNKEEILSINQNRSESTTPTVVPSTTTISTNVDLENIEQISSTSTLTSTSTTPTTILFEREDGGKHYIKGKDYDDVEEIEADESNHRLPLNNIDSTTSSQEEMEEEEEIEDTSDIPTDSSIKGNNIQLNITNTKNNNKPTQQSKSNKKNKNKKSSNTHSNNNSNTKSQQTSLYSVNKGKNNTNTKPITSNHNNQTNNKKSQKSNLKNDIFEFLNEHIKIIIILLLIIATTLIFQNL